VAGLSWDLERSSDDCVDELVERFVFDIELGAVSDDGGTGGLTLMLFQTMGPQVMMMPTPIPARAWPQQRRDGGTASTASPGTHVWVKRAREVWGGETCFAEIARDPLGHLSAGGNVGGCAHTTAPPFFRGCRVAGSGDPGAGGLLASLALL